MGEFSIVHWIVVFGVILLIFGPKKLPEIARSLGESIKEFKKAFKEGSASDNSKSSNNTN